MKRFVLVLTLLGLLAACGPAPTPSPTPDLEATMSAFSGTMVAGTLTAQPTNTLPPTETTTPLPREPATLPPTNTPDPSLPTATNTLIPGAPTPTLFTGSNITGNLEGLGVAILRVENLSGVKEIIVTIEGVTKPREVPVYLSYKVTGALNFNIYTGSLNYKV